MKVLDLFRPIRIPCIAMGLLVSGWALGQSETPTANPTLFTNPEFTEQISELFNPGVFADWAGVMNNPKSLTNISQLDPTQLQSFISVMTNPGFLSAMSNSGNPEMVESWLAIMTNPQSMSSAMQGLDPATMESWLQAVTNIELMKPLLGMADPNYFNQWVGVMTEPAMLDSFMRILDPKLVMSLLGNTIPMMAAANQATATDGGETTDSGSSQ